ncbi:MAG: dihydroorotate dehydrogenase [Gemmatimonadetes bacterium]|jgi:dihydroorotate dehydrogenase (NAD+) catalytic subunit|nr:dihydroorotate dehydrogenase [Gemmatimonadota bacterium]
MNLQADVFGVRFQNPVLLAAGTCGFGQELSDVVDLEALGGFVTKSVTVEPRPGNPAPRVAEFGGGMLNSIGLANPGLEATKREKLPWIRANVRRAHVLVSIAGHSPGEYFKLIEGLDGESGFLGFEVNLSCPNDAKRGGPPFALDPRAVAEILDGCRSRTERPLVAKLAPNDLDLAHTVRVAAEAGADGLTLVNTVPGLLLRPGSGAPELGAGQGGMSGPALRPVGLRAVMAARAATDLPILGVGGIFAAQDAVAYARAGATLVEMGTASFAAPRAAERVIKGLRVWGRRHRVDAWRDLGGENPNQEAVWRK